MEEPAEEEEVVEEAEITTATQGWTGPMEEEAEAEAEAGVGAEVGVEEGPLLGHRQMQRHTNRGIQTQRDTDTDTEASR